MPNSVEMRAMKANNAEAACDRVVLESVVTDVVSHAKEGEPSETQAPRMILIVPWGDVRSASGAFVADAQAMSETVAAFERHGTDLPIDYEHQTLGGPYSSPDGQAPAAGWIRALRIVSPADVAKAKSATDEDAAPDASKSETRTEADTPPAPGLWAEVTWTAAARKRLEDRQYRYLSPVALVRRSDRRLVELHSAALTNKPAIVGMRPVVNRAEDTERELMTGSEPPIGEQSTAADPNDKSQEQAAERAALCEALALEAATPDEALLAAALSRIHALEADRNERIAAERVAHAMSAGKLSAAQRDWAMTLALRDPQEFDRWEAAAPAVVALGRLDPPDGEDTVRASRGVEASARAEWRANRAVLQKLCTEEAYVATALRDSAAEAAES